MEGLVGVHALHMMYAVRNRGRKRLQSQILHNQVKCRSHVSRLKTYICSTETISIRLVNTSAATIRCKHSSHVLPQYYCRAGQPENTPEWQSGRVKLALHACMVARPTKHHDTNDIIAECIATINHQTIWNCRLFVVQKVG